MTIAGYFILGFCAGWYANKWLDAREALEWAKQRVEQAEAQRILCEAECEERIKAVRDSFKLPWSGDSYEA